MGITFHSTFLGIRFSALVRELISHLELYNFCTSSSGYCVYSVSQKIPMRFSGIFPKRLGIFSPNFTHLICVFTNAGQQIFIQLSRNLTKLCYIKRDHPVHTITPYVQNVHHRPKRTLAFSDTFTNS